VRAEEVIAKTDRLMKAILIHFLDYPKSRTYVACVPYRYEGTKSATTGFKITNSPHTDYRRPKQTAELHYPVVTLK
jgi:hypothetical protein